MIFCLWNSTILEYTVQSLHMICEDVETERLKSILSNYVSPSYFLSSFITFILMSFFFLLFSIYYIFFNLFCFLFLLSLLPWFLSPFLFSQFILFFTLLGFFSLFSFTMMPFFFVLNFLYFFTLFSCWHSFSFSSIVFQLKKAWWLLRYEFGIQIYFKNEPQSCEQIRK